MKEVQEEQSKTHEEEFNESLKGLLNGIVPEEEFPPISKIYGNCMSFLEGQNGFHVYAALLLIMAMNFRSVENESDRKFYFDTLIERMRALIGIEDEKK